MCFFLPFIVTVSIALWEISSKRWKKTNRKRKVWTRNPNIRIDFTMPASPRMFHALAEIFTDVLWEITAALERLLQQVDALHLPPTCKLWLYQHFVVTKLCWFFTALDLSQTFVKSLQSKATKFFKSWSWLPRSANTAILFLGKSGRTGVNGTNLVTYWKQMQLVHIDVLKRSADPRCNLVYDALLKRQTFLAEEIPARSRTCVRHNFCRIKPRSRKSWSWTPSYEIKNGKQAAFKPKPCSEMGLRYRRGGIVGQAPSAWSAQSLVGMGRYNERRPNLAASDFGHVGQWAEIHSSGNNEHHPLRLITYVDGTVYRLTVVAPSLVAHVLFVTSWTRVAFRCARVATVGDITLFFPCSSVIHSSFGIT